MPPRETRPTRSGISRCERRLTCTSVTAPFLTPHQITPKGTSSPTPMIANYPRPSVTVAAVESEMESNTARPTTKGLEIWLSQ